VQSKKTLTTMFAFVVEKDLMGEEVVLRKLLMRREEEGSKEAVIGVERDFRNMLKKKKKTEEEVGW